MKLPSITIPVMVYRNAQSLPDTVASILRLNIDDLEVILSDDGSPEDMSGRMEEAAEALRKKYPRVRVDLEKENVGTVKHFNRLIKSSSGTYIVPCSAGDAFADANTLGELIGRMEKRGEMILAARHRDIYPERTKDRPGRLFGTMLNLLPKKALESMIVKRNQISGCAVIYTRRLFERYGVFDEDYRLLDDYPYYVTLLKKGESIPYVHRVLTDHPMGGVSNGKVHPQIYRDLCTMHRKLLEEPEGLSGKTVAFLENKVKEEKDGD